MSTDTTRLYLVGDDEALDVLSELARYLPLLQHSRLDALPAEPFTEHDVIVIGAVHPRTRDALLRDTMSRGKARHVAIMPAVGADAGARAILVAAELVRLLVVGLDAPPAG